ncbi:unnamed protein product [Bursaphelenchus xylophilus]|uniref:(pine wood nematode) hypothetical protein n=1 Tax=Bursaphelenchus xylophilus TaxID=6326 RepID=A0A1I7SQS6_BURXY|nr:unnamed protein product [Bursaphelenchus xylophilus]CAG9110328.1 unnamed protein product [Bursaphelenchus xylophilus]
MRARFLLMFLVQGAMAAESIESSSSSERCELPVNFQSLPIFAQDEIRAVWKNYVPGQSCKKEVLITEDILSVLEMFDKELTIDKDFLSSGSKFNHFTTNPLGKNSNEKPPDDVAVTTWIWSSTEAPSTSTEFLVRTTTQLPVLWQKVKKDEAPSAELGFPTLVPFINQKLIVSESSESFEATTTPTTTTTFSWLTSTTSTEIPTTFSTTTLSDERVTQWIDAFDRSHQDHGHVEPQNSSGDDKSIDDQSKQLEERDARGHQHEYPGQLIRRPLKTRVNFHEYQDYEEILREEARREQQDAARKRKEIGNDKFFEPIDSALPFLRGASPRVQQVFKEVLNDPDVLSEGRRQDELHVLAVSYLEPEQLEAYNNWAFARRKRIIQREEQLYPLSRPARTALKDLSLTAAQSRMRKVKELDSEIREELKDYAIRLREERH